MELKEIYDEVSSGKPFDVKKVKEQLEHAATKIKEDAKIEKSHREIQETGNEAEKVLDDAEDLRALAAKLPDHG